VLTRKGGRPHCSKSLCLHFENTVIMKRIEKFRNKKKPRSSQVPNEKNPQCTSREALI
jgi:hypothetical protein